MWNLPNKTLDQKLDDILSNQSVILSQITNLQTSINNLNIPPALNSVSFKKLLGDSLTDASGVSQIKFDPVSNQYDFSTFLPFISLGSNPVQLWLSKEFKKLLNK